MNNTTQWDVRYEWQAITLLTLAFGLVGLDRFALPPLFPAMMHELRLSYQDLGTASAVLAVAWGAAAAIAGSMTDRLGRRRIVISATVAFSVLVGLTGLVTGIGSLLAMRIAIGLAEGAFVPGSISGAIAAAKPSRRGAVYGLQQNGLPLIGLGLGPIIATQLLRVTGSWRWTFAIIALPGLLVAWLLFRVLRNAAPSTTAPTPTVHGPAATATAGPKRWHDALRYRNVPLAAAIMVCMSGALNVVLVMTPSYLVDYLKMSSAQMGLVTSGTGLGSLLLGTALPGLSDRVGRKAMLLVSTVGAAIALWVFMSSGIASPLPLFVLLMLISGFGFAVIYIDSGPLTAESVPAAIASTAAGLVVGIGEIVGGGIAPVVAGSIAARIGIQHVFAVALVLLVCCAVAVLALKEPRRAATAPLDVRQPSPAQ